MAMVLDVHLFRITAKEPLSLPELWRRLHKQTISVKRDRKAFRAYKDLLSKPTPSVMAEIVQPGSYGKFELTVSGHTPSSLHAEVVSTDTV